VGRFLVVFKVFNVYFKTLDHLLAELRPFGELFLDLLVDFDVSFERLDLGLHLVVLVNELLSMHGLVLQLSCKLLVLQDSELCRGL